MADFLQKLPSVKGMADEQPDPPAEEVQACRETMTIILSRYGDILGDGTQEVSVETISNYLKEHRKAGLLVLDEETVQALDVPMYCSVSDAAKRSALHMEQVSRPFFHGIQAKLHGTLVSGAPVFCHPGDHCCSCR